MAIVATNASAVPGNSPQSRWADSLKRAIRDPDQLCRRLQLPPQMAQSARSAAQQFPLFVPEEFLARIQPGHLGDPLLRQILPLNVELNERATYERDPLEERDHPEHPAGFLQKYEGRALLMVASRCAVHCRYCFRRHYPYDQLPVSPDQFEPALGAIRSDKSIHEIIFSGGDPLMMVDRQLADLSGRLQSITHLRRLRIHTRLPIMIPNRVCDELLNWIVNSRLTTWMVVHVNHAQEIDRAVERAISQLVDAGVPVLNQSVLLRGVNDSAEAQIALAERLIDLRAIPYYLHELDRVQGAAHFQTPEGLGREIIAEMRRVLPGFAVPRYVREIPGEGSKTLLA